MNFIELIDNEEIPQSEVIELAGAPLARMASDNWHLNTEENRDRLTELSEERAADYDYQLFALVDDGRREGAVWFPVEVDWRSGLEQDPIPGWALNAALTHLVDSGAIECGPTAKGQTWLAGRVEMNPSTVRRWVSGTTTLAGTTARVVRMEIEEALR